MRGRVDRQQSMFVAFDLQHRLPRDHPLRPIKAWCDRLLASMSRDFDRAYGAGEFLCELESRGVEPDADGDAAGRDMRGSRRPRPSPRPTPRPPGTQDQLRA